jgi:hypothetical protein
MVGGAIATYHYEEKYAPNPDIVSTPPTVHDTSNDPPVIMHGGSFHVYLQLNSQPISGPPLKMDENDTSTVAFAGYTAMGAASAAPPSKLAAPWEVDVCDAAPGSDKLCQPPGVKVIAASSTAMTVDLLGGSGKTRYNSSTTPPPPVDYYPYHVLAADSSEIHPGYLVIQSGGKTTDYQCAPKDGDWANCMVQLGRYTLTEKPQ